MSRHLPPPTTASPISYPDQLTASLHHLVHHYPPSSLAPSGGLYSGLLSVVYLFWKLSALLPGKTVDGLSLRDWFEAYWAEARRYERALLGDAGVEGIKVRPWRCGVGDDTIVYAFLLSITSVHSSDSGQAHVQAFCRAVGQVVGARSAAQERKHGKQASNEWLYGRAGTLYLLRTIRHALNSSDPDVHTVESTIRSLVKEIVDAPRPWMWHGKPYLGAVHGSAGIITQVLKSMHAIGMEGDQTLLDTLQDDVEHILSLQLPSGNWPSSIPASGNAGTSSDRLLQFCHGSPGIIPCLHTISASYPSLSGRINTAIHHAQEDIFRRGWLRKEPCLCHGATGNALSLPPGGRDVFLSGATEDSVRVLQGKRVVEVAEAGEGLFTGVAGRAWVWGLMAVPGREVGEGMFLGFDDV